MSTEIHHIAIFASGAGSNAARIIADFKTKPQLRICRIYSNKANAGVRKVAEENQIPFTVFGREVMSDASSLIRQLQADNTSWIILAGFLWKVPGAVVQDFPDRIINIHPALLPKFGGKGMYGMNVHRAVKEANEKESGITIHFVNENYDEGAIIRQEKVELNSSDTPESIAMKVQKLEHEWFPRVIEQLILKS